MISLRRKKKGLKAKGRKILVGPDLSNVVSTNKDFTRLFYGALHYAQYDVADKQLKKEMLKYAKAQKLDHKLLGLLSDKDFQTVGKLALIINAGGELPESFAVGFPAGIERLMVRARAIRAEQKAAAKAASKVVSSRPKATIQDRMRDQAASVAQEFDGWLDMLATDPKANITDKMNPTTAITVGGLKAGHTRWIKKFYEDDLEELKAALAGEDADLKEGYSNLSKAQLKKMIALLESIMTAVNVAVKVQKAQKAPRKKKAVSVDKLVAKLKYKEKDDELGLASLNPRDIVGAQMIWIYNTKYRKLGRYVAADDAGLGVKGSSITNFSEDKSRNKSLRKPKEQLKEFQKAGKVALRTFFEDIKAVDHKLKARTSADMIILKIVK
jgi:hypothetical protein